MQKILSSKQIREADSATIEREPISSEALMERAANACVKWINNRFDRQTQFVVLAGVGNNGGDALVIARRLLQLGFHVQTYLIRYSEKFSADCQINLDRLQGMGHEIIQVLEEDHIPGFSANSVVIDGLFGSGLNRPVEGLAATCIEQLNAGLAEVISIDIPSGMYADKPTESTDSVVLASMTLTFQTPKLSFLLPGSEAFLKDWEVLDIGLNPAFIRDVKSDYYLIDQVDEYSHSLNREKFDHKGTYGNALIVSGSYGKMGAAVLASKAALKTGAGKLTAHIPRCGYNIFQATLVEAMCMVDDYVDFIGDAPNLDGYDAIGIGPGIGGNKKTRRVVKKVLTSSQVPVVVDADALNAIASHEDGLKWLPKSAILTPHVGEFERLFGKCENAFERLEKAREAAKKNEVYIVLKGAYSTICTPLGKVYFNSTGNPGMATAGSGDVLTGVIVGLLAQGVHEEVACILGVYLHGMAGDFAAEFGSEHTLMASDIIESLSNAFNHCLK